MDKSKGRGRTLLTYILWPRCFNVLLLLLLFCFINSIGSATAGNSPRRVTGEKGGSVTLPCEFQPRDDSHIVVFRQSKKILDCQNEECSERFVKKGSCDVIIKDLIFSDAGKYFLRVFNTDGQKEVERDYHLHIQGKIFGKTGEELKMNILLANADKVKTNSSGEWTEVWTRGHGVSSDRLTDRDGNLTISNFTVSDTGTYRVLDSEEEILITVTVTESSPGSNGKLDMDEEQHTAGFWILSVGLPVLVILVLVGVTVVIKKQYLDERYSQGHRSPEESDQY
ncbi:uncharacterized protein LOC125265302 isoform X2 [Megalobrama amblycephala]|uniref:uncharacterized protein LOC125265302 isoform X2 n=1 Tax=Megalobrama amblycephala TaxID=75352 RepID=UPI002013E453|nr:uncharacterized protein LOC125265302 isoform X2 [Megalobrama amblycephala]